MYNTLWAGEKGLGYAKKREKEVFVKLGSSDVFVDLVLRQKPKNKVI